ncbi:FtsX-like permease family protein [Anaerobacterium chartisolvens]|uniref:FtsX-like permease family protein n=1 Tax=Anaerobacterium chartisolvens TaxID=1297424 RepID=A0A369BHV2_9FIRM|nr:FtsX-like permease family protein [Anaerobacterium chartisolvens]RCX20845.1 FtsX-like permease family protein [Anaerobacterium chartisolvens]
MVAKKLDIKVGDTVIIETPFDKVRKAKNRLIVTGIVKKYMGNNCYLPITSMGDILKEGVYATGAVVKSDTGMFEKAKRELLKIRGIKMLQSRIEEYENSLQMFDIVYLFVAIMIIFGSIMGFASIFNSTVINIMERRRELASLKVLGYTKAEIEKLLMRESVILGVISLAPGAILGRLLCELFAEQFSTDVLVIPAIVKISTYIISFISIFVFIILAQKANEKNIFGLDIVEVLKNKEG